MFAMFRYVVKDKKDHRLTHMLKIFKFYKPYDKSEAQVDEVKNEDDINTSALS